MSAHFEKNQQATGRVLVVEDDERIRKGLRDLLQREGFEVVTAQDGREALEIFRETNPDLVLTDVEMPLVNGFELCRAIKSNPKTRLIPVVLLTGLRAVADRVTGIEAGADDFISKPFEPVELLARVRSLLLLKQYTDELESAEAVIYALSRAIEGKDPYTEGHCERLSQYGVTLGCRLGRPEKEIEALRKAGSVHDIGKIVIPDAVLKKEGPLTEEEFLLVKEHPVVGEDICRPLKSFDLVRPIIRHHHERLDASGYPDGLEGDAIPITARILSIVDVYDALTTDRPYRSALSPEEALAIMEGEVEKGWWDREIFMEWCRHVRDAPGPMPETEALRVE